MRILKRNTQKVLTFELLEPGRLVLLLDQLFNDCEFFFCQLVSVLKNKILN